MFKFIPSAQQTAFFSWVSHGSGSAVLEAVAGSGKTTTLIEALKLMNGKIYFGAYNKSIVEELSARIPEGVNVKVSTLHATGFGLMKKVAPKCTVENAKCRDIYRMYSGNDRVLKQMENSVVNLVSYAKQAGVGIVTDISNTDAWVDLIDNFSVEDFGYVDTLIKYAKAVLEASNKQYKDSIDFDDMVYLPLLLKVVTPFYDWVLIDEAQDINVTRRLLSLGLLKETGRLVAVGDVFQAIYGFTGADSDSLDNISAATDAIKFPLSVTYRCPSSVVEQAQKYVPHIESHPEAPEGIVRSLPDVAAMYSEIRRGDVILCRYNAPLVSLVYSFILEGIPAKIEGRDIGAGLKALASKWKSPKNFTEYVEKLDTWADAQVEKFKLAGKSHLVESTVDKVDCLKVIIERVVAEGIKGGSPTDILVKEIDNIFGDVPVEGYVVLSSIHKAKGLEWNKVYYLRTPIHPRTKEGWPLQNEYNLRYVAITRSMYELVFINIERKALSRKSLTAAKVKEEVYETC